MSGCEATIVLNYRIRIHYNCSTNHCAKNWIHNLWNMGPSQSKCLNENSTVTVFIQKWNVCRFIINIEGNFISFGGCLTLTFYQYILDIFSFICQFWIRSKWCVCSVYAVRRITVSKSRCWAMHFVCITDNVWSHKKKSRNALNTSKIKHFRQ